MYKVEGSVLANDMEWIPDADVAEVSTGKKTVTDYGGQFSLMVDAPTSEISIGKVGYKTQVMTAKDFNAYGIAYLDYGIVVRTKPKNNNLLLVLLVAGAITTGVVIYSKKRAKAKPIKIK